MISTYPTTDGRLVRSANSYLWVNRTCVADTNKIPSQESYDLLTPATYALLMQAESYPWLPANEAVNQKPQLLGPQNQCIWFNDSIYICDGRFIALEEFILGSSLQEKKLKINRIAQQISCCHTLLTASHYTRPGDSLTDATEQILSQFFASKCVQAQRRYFEDTNELSADMCVWMNGSVYIRSGGEYKKLSSVFRHMTETKADKMLRELAQLAADLHSIITIQDSIA